MQEEPAKERKVEIKKKMEQLGGTEREMWELAEVCDDRVDANWQSMASCLVSVFGFLATLVLAAVVVVLYGPRPCP